MSDASIADRARFDRLRYAQVWEDADVLSDALDVRPGGRVLCIASAGDNALALLTRDPAEVVAVDLSGAQLAALALRIAAFRRLDHTEVVELIGARPSERRAALYARCRDDLDTEARAFWDARPDEVARGIGTGGKFERYLALFRRVVLPLTQSRGDVQTLLAGGGTPESRRAWYDAHWDSWRWRAVFGVFASRFVMGRLGRDPSFLDHVEGPVAVQMRARIRTAVTATDPAENPYLHWILTGTYGRALPPYLRPEAFETIRSRLGRITPVKGALETVLAESPPRSFDGFGLSDVFEYVDEPHAADLLERIARAGRPGARIAYWNLLAPRSRPPSLADRIRPLPNLSAALHARDRAPFYRAFVVEEVV
ncbi:MAG: DUF3419 family protein [Bacteroidota bacterium]